MTAVTTSHIVLDERGIAYIEGKRFKVVHIVMDMMNGHTPRQISEHYPHLTLAEIYAALAYYYDHQMELDAWIDESQRRAHQLREEAKGTQPTRAELEARLRAKGGGV